MSLQLARLERGEDVQSSGFDFLDLPCSIGNRLMLSSGIWPIKSLRRSLKISRRQPIALAFDQRRSL